LHAAWIRLGVSKIRGVLWGRSVDVSDATAGRYADLLEGSLMARLLN
jgi:hypothetical protein